MIKLQIDQAIDGIIMSECNDSVFIYWVSQKQRQSHMYELYAENELMLDLLQAFTEQTINW